MMTTNERTVMYETVRSYLEETAPEDLPRLDESFDALFTTADEQWRDLKESGREPGERGTPFDPVSFGSGMFVATLVWMSLNLTRGAQAETGSKEVEKHLRRLEDRLADRSGYPEIVFALRRTLLEILKRETALASRAEDASGEPDLQIYVVRDRHQGRLVFSLTARDRSLNLRCRRFESPPFERDPEAWFYDFFQDLEVAAKEAVSTTRLVAAGNELAQRLLSPDLRHCLGSLPERVKSVEILSEEPWVPWELVRLWRREESPAQARFLCEAFAVTRWIEGPSEARGFPLRRIAVSLSGGEDLPNLAEEREFLLGLAGEGREVREVPATYLEVLAALSSGRWDAWHFAGHGTARSSQPGRRGLVMEDGELLRPQDLHALAGRLDGTRPLIFLNACSGLRGGVSLTGVAGLAEQFLQVGAGAVVGTRWGVPDSQAAAFVKAFYSSFRAGLPLGEAVYRSRRALRGSSPEKAAWLAYAAYGHPLAAVA